MLQASLVPGMVGLYEVIVVSRRGPVNGTETSIELSQGAYLSNDDAFPLVNSGGTASSAPFLSIFSTHSGAFAQGDTASNMTAPDTSTSR